MPDKKQKLFSRGLEYEVLFCFKQDKHKKVFKALKKDSSTGLKQEVLVKIFSRSQPYEEFKSLSEVISPYCVRLLGFERFGQDQALILESIKGVSLFQLLSHYRLKKKESSYILNSIYKGLKDLKHYGLAHGDLSLDNVLINEKAQVKLIDFGRGNYEKESFYTLPFTAPEVRKGFRPRFSSDLYSLGVISEFFDNPKLLNQMKESSPSEKEMENSFLSSAVKKNPLLSPDPLKRQYQEDKQKENLEALKSLSIKVKELLAEIEFRQCQTIKKTPVDSFNWISFFRNTGVALVLLFFIGSQSYTPAFGLLKIYTHKWFFVENPLIQSYTPLNVLMKEGWHEIQWKNQASKGKKRVFIPKEEVLVLNDNFFQN